jgi:cation diffusion facilitator CzcD-associated flavoprotein CzcO
MTTEKVCIVGAGPAGLAAAKALHTRGIPFDCFEVRSGIGGVWRYQPETEFCTVYESLHTNTSAGKMAFSDFSMPGHYPAYPNHRQVLEYLEQYADRFAFRRHIRLRTRVRRITPRNHGVFDVEVQDSSGCGSSEQYAAVIVACGHFGKPRWPRFRGKFDGALLHSAGYRTPDIARDKNVLVVGIGNSAADIACETSRVARRVLLSYRETAHVVPKFLFGRPTDTFNTAAVVYIPTWLQARIFQAAVRLANGDQAVFGLPRPAYPFGLKRPTIHDSLLGAIAGGQVQLRSEVRELAGAQVRFADGTTEPVDLILCATGFETELPFFNRETQDSYARFGSLYLNIVPEDLPNLFFLGFVEVYGPVFPVVEAQANWVAELLRGSFDLPSRASMDVAMQDWRRVVTARFESGNGGLPTVDLYRYLRLLQQEREIGPLVQKARALKWRFTRRRLQSAGAA